MKTLFHHIDLLQLRSLLIHELVKGILLSFYYIIWTECYFVMMEMQALIEAAEAKITSKS